MNFLNKSYGIIVNSKIIEYDIKSANTSISREYNLIPEMVIEKIEALEKDDRHKAFGLIMRDNKELNSRVEEAFNKAVKSFIYQNQLKEDDILGVKRDAVFVINKKIEHPMVGENILFRPKNTYQSYLHLSPYELYFTKNKDDYDIDIKGLSSNKDTRDKLLMIHEDGILSFVKDVLDLLSSNERNPQPVNEYVKEFVKAYKERKLPIKFYREFNQNSLFKVKTPFGGGGYFQSVDNPDYLDILYNYNVIVLPILRLACL